MSLKMPDNYKHNSYRRSKKQETELAGKLGGYRVPGSGAGNEKGDVRVRGLLRVEAKTTSKKSYSVSTKLIDTIEQEALSSTELPAIILEFTNDEGKPTHTAAIMPLWALEELTNQAGAN